MDPEAVKIDAGVSYLPRNLGFGNTIMIDIRSEIEELVQDQNGIVTLLGSYPTPEDPYQIRFEPRYFTPSYIFQLLHQFLISETQLCHILSQRIALGYLLFRGPEPFLLSFHVKLIRQVLTMLPPSVTAPSIAVSDHVLQRLVDEQRVESLNLKEEEEEEEISCSICLENLLESRHKKIIRMPNCLHLFHQGCIFEWLKLQNSCPLCRRVLYEDEDVAGTPSLA